MDDHLDEHDAWSAFMSTAYFVQELVPPLPAWMAAGRCRDADPEAFFPEVGDQPDAALRVCATCSVREQCLDYAIAEELDEGVWGGTTARQRARLGRKAAA